MVIPLMTLMLFAILKFGIALNNNLALTDGVRAGARQFAIGRGSDTVHSDAVRSFYAAAPTIAPGKVTLALSVSGATCTDDTSCKLAMLTASGQPAELVASTPCDLRVLAFNFAPGCMLSSSTTERVE